MNLTDVAFNRDNPIYATELANFRRDTKRFKKNKGQSRRNLIKSYIASILNRMTLPNSSVSPLLPVGSLLAVHSIA
jgi:hypothetical protein